MIQWCTLYNKAVTVHVTLVNQCDLMRRYYKPVSAYQDPVAAHGGIEVDATLLTDARS